MGGAWKIEYGRSRNERTRAKGLCLNCRKIAVEAHKLCVLCAAKMRERNALKRQKVIEHYGGACACCGEADAHFLSLDHINNDGAKHRKSLGNSAGRGYQGTAFYHWVVKVGFPTDLQLLCHNCNCAKGFYGICPHDAMREALLCA